MKQINIHRTRKPVTILPLPHPVSRYFYLESVPKSLKVMLVISASLLLLAYLNNYNGWLYLFLGIVWVFYGMDVFVQNTIRRSTLQNIRQEEYALQTKEQRSVTFNNDGVRYTINGKQWDWNWTQFCAYQLNGHDLQLMTASSSITISFAEGEKGSEAWNYALQQAALHLPEFNTYLHDTLHGLSRA